MTFVLRQPHPHGRMVYPVWIWVLGRLGLRLDLGFDFRLDLRFILRFNFGLDFRLDLRFDLRLNFRLNLRFDLQLYFRHDPCPVFRIFVRQDLSLFLRSDPGLYRRNLLFNSGFYDLRLYLWFIFRLCSLLFFSSLTSSSFSPLTLLLSHLSPLPSHLSPLLLSHLSPPVPSPD